jgi:hypothetical protein
MIWADLFEISVSVEGLVRSISFITWFVVGAAASLFGADAMLVAKSSARANEAAPPAPSMPSTNAPCTPSEPDSSSPGSLWPRPKYAEVKPQLDDADELAALDAIRFALAEVADGSSYVWYRANGHLSGVFRPTTSFKNMAGHVCRHIVVTLTAGITVKQTEGIACRLARGRWHLHG